MFIFMRCTSYFNTSWFKKKKTQAQLFMYLTASVVDNNFALWPLMVPKACYFTKLYALLCDSHVCIYLIKNLNPSYETLFRWCFLCKFALNGTRLEWKLNTQTVCLAASKQATSMQEGALYNYNVTYVYECMSCYIYILILVRVCKLSKEKIAIKFWKLVIYQTHSENVKRMKNFHCYPSAEVTFTSMQSAHTHIQVTHTGAHTIYMY